MKDNQFSLRTLLGGVAFCCFLALFLRVVVWPVIAPLTPGYWDSVSDMYAVTQTQEMLSMYVAANEGQGPTKWGDLQQEFDYTDQAYSFENMSSLQERVSIDFSALRDLTLEDLQSDEAATPIIRLKENLEREINTLSEQEVESNRRLRNTMRWALQ